MSTLQSEAVVPAADLTNCDREPIHLPGRVQPHGVLLVLEEPSLRVLQASGNAAAHLGVPAAQALIGKDLSAVLGADLAPGIVDRLERERLTADPLLLATVRPDGGDRRYHILAHRFNGRLIVELEPASPEDLTFQVLHSRVRSSIAQVQAARDVQGVCDAVAREIRQITGYDRVMVYQFDGRWNGRVVAEDLAPGTRSYLHQHFPASDIPAQARQLYTLNRIRLIADVSYAPSDILPANDPVTGRPLDLSYSVLRSVSPVHLEYLRNMGVGSSMSISIIKDEKLWGLVACHHGTAKFVPYDVRMACDLLGQVVALQLSAKEYTERSEHRLSLRRIQTRLLAGMAGHEDFVTGLVEGQEHFLALAGATGGAVVVGDEIVRLGQTPGADEVRALVDWLRTAMRDEVYYTDSLASVYPQAEAFGGVVAGLIGISIPRQRKSYVLWFRPEVVRTIDWAGNPEKPVTRVGGDGGGAASAGAGDEAGVRLHPRKSFETWRQTVRLRCLPWRPSEVEAVLELREAIVEIVLRKAEELAQLNADLRRSNKELEAFSYSVSHDLRAPFRHIVGFSNLLQKQAADKLDATSRRYIQTISEAARYAGTLVDSLLTFSQMGRSALRLEPVPMKKLVDEVRSDAQQQEAPGRGIEWRVDELPKVVGDVTMLRLALRNLLANAIKYSRKRDPARIHIGFREEPEEYVFFVRDNGVGFDMRYADKLFGVFQRLHRMEDFEGTGIGLANVRRIIERHGGRTYAEGEPEKGATFYFTLPKGQ